MRIHRGKPTAIAVFLLFGASLLISCASSANEAILPTYDPFIPLQGATLTSGNAPLQPAASNPQASALTPTSLPTHRPAPARAPLSLALPTEFLDPPIFLTPTPDSGHLPPTQSQAGGQYVVQPGDLLGTIADSYGVSLEELMAVNGLTDPNTLSVGLTLNIPTPVPGQPGQSLKLIPDSELVYGPATVYFDLESVINAHQGYLKDYQQEIDGRLYSGAEIIALVAQNYSVNPRLLLALLEHQSGWLTNPAPSSIDYPLGLVNPARAGLYHQLTWAADQLNRGYYLWKANAISTWIMADGVGVSIDTGINPGTAGVQHFFSRLDGESAWHQHVGPTGFLLTYYVLFGNPFKYAIEPLLPSNLTQPAMNLPFTPGETWYFTGGPHGGWDSGSAWAALDFAPPGDNGSCLPSSFWVTAAADGLVVRAGDGSFIQDLDNDGYEQTGWVIFYMHIARQDRALPGTYLFSGDHVGHPSCEGGVSNATHAHIARKYNGEWIPADGALPFNLDGWISGGGGSEYDGFISRAGVTLEAWDGMNPINAITR